MGIIGIITDFGSRGLHFVAEMKGVALQINPNAKFIDVIHDIMPFSIIEAAYILKSVVHRFPKDSIFVCVVDPGVGTDRDIVAVQLTTGQIIIGPDNGMFTYFALNQNLEVIIKITSTEYYYNPNRNQIFTPKLSENTKNTSINNVEKKKEKNAFKKEKTDEDLFNSDFPLDEKGPDLFSIKNDTPFDLEDSIIPGDRPEMAVPELNLDPESTISSTFHGRDIMMPVAAHLSKGLDIFALGVPKENVEIIEDLEPEILKDGRSIQGLIQYIDAFSNIITNIPIREFDAFVEGIPSSYELNHESHYYQLTRASIFAGNASDKILLIDGASGYLEICMNRGKASQRLNAQVGQKILIVIIRKGEVLLPDEKSP